MSTAVIGDIYLETMVGDKVMKHVQHLTWHRKAGGRTGEELHGYVLASPDGKKIMGAGDILFVDLGRENGIATGQKLWIRSASADAGAREPELTGLTTPPQKYQGTVEIVIAREKTSVGRITESHREIVPGAKVISQ